MKLVIEGRFPGLNEFIEEMNGSRWGGARMKKKQTARVEDAAILARLPHVNGKVDVHFHWVEPNALRDLDNIRFAAKFILDGLVKAKVLTDDSRRYVGGLSDSFAVDKEHPRVEVTLTASKERHEQDL